MGLKFWAMFLLLSLAVVAESSPYSFGFVGAGDLSVSVGDSMDAFDEMMMDSEINRRQLAGRRRYVSYGALKKNTVPCNRRGHSYYNCNKMKRANPYKRGCSAITHLTRLIKVMVASSRHDDEGLASAAKASQGRAATAAETEFARVATPIS
ncbi:hypothetical protein NL676_012869 [Syzygium grande]|nr:hypothetical protein NL676_012869 [Syzygium grande]